MVVKLRADASPQAVRELIQQLTIHADITGWPLRIADRRFLVLSGDESLIPPEPLDDPTIHAYFSTAADGYWFAARSSGLSLSPVTIGSTRVGSGLPLWCAAGPCALEDLERAVAVVRAWNRVVRQVAAVPARLRCTTFTLEREDFDETGAVDVVLSPNQVSLHDSRTTHGARPNASQRPRTGFAMRYFPASVKVSAERMKTHKTLARQRQKSRS